VSDWQDKEGKAGNVKGEKKEGEKEVKECCVVSYQNWILAAPLLCLLCCEFTLIHTTVWGVAAVSTRHTPTECGMDWIEQCFTSPPTQYRLYGRRFLQVKRPNQQHQSTEGIYSTQRNHTIIRL